MAGQRIHLIVNPISGRRRGRRERIDEFVSRLVGEGHDVQMRQTEGPGDAAWLAREACEAAADLVCVAGGDGTVHDAVGGLAGSDVPVLVIPCGTENVVAKYLGLRLRVNRLWAAFAARQLQRFRLMRANGRNVLFSCGLGIDGEIAKRVSTRRRGHISYGTYVQPMLSMLFGYQLPRVNVSVNEKEVYSGNGFALMGKVPRYAMGLRVLWRAEPADDRIDVVVLPRRRPVALAWDLMRILVNPRWRSPDSIYVKGQTVRVTAHKPVAVQMDGEFTGYTPVEATLSDQIVCFVVGPRRRT